MKSIFTDFERLNLSTATPFTDQQNPALCRIEHMVSVYSLITWEIPPSLAIVPAKQGRLEDELSFAKSEMKKSAVKHH